MAAWKGIYAVVNSHVEDGSFGHKYPLQCPDGRGAYGCDRNAFGHAVEGEVGIPWPTYPSDASLPPTLLILDLIEFCHRILARPVQRGFHDFYGHTHLSFEPEEGRAEFREEVNRVLARNGLAFELEESGRVVRLGPPALAESLRSAVFKTGDDELDRLLETARTKFLDPDPNVRAEALEKLWDAWERLKTLEQGKDKKAQATALLDRATSGQKFRELLEEEARSLTAAGNAFQIRHSETTQEPLESVDHVDYLFHRMFAMIRLLLKTTGRGG